MPDAQRRSRQGYKGYRVLRECRTYNAEADRVIRVIGFLESKGRTMQKQALLQHHVTAVPTGSAGA